MPTLDRLHCTCPVNWHGDCHTACNRSQKSIQQECSTSLHQTLQLGQIAEPRHTLTKGILLFMERRLSDNSRMQQTGRCAVTAEYTGKSLVYTTSNESSFRRRFPLHTTHMQNSGALEDGRVALSNEPLQLVVGRVLAIRSIDARLCRPRVQGALEGLVRRPQPLSKVVLNASPARDDAQALEVLAGSQHNHRGNWMCTPATPTLSSALLRWRHCSAGGSRTACA